LEYQLILIQERPLSLRECFFTLERLIRFTKSREVTTLVLLWIAWNWKEKRELPLRVQPLIASGRIIKSILLILQVTSTSPSKSREHLEYSMELFFSSVELVVSNLRL